MVMLTKGTTTLAFIIKDGVKVTVDSRACMGGYFYDVEKIMEMMIKETVRKDVSVVVVDAMNLDSLCRAFDGCSCVFHTSAFIDPSGISDYTFLAPKGRLIGMGDSTMTRYQLPFHFENDKDITSCTDVLGLKSIDFVSRKRQRKDTSSTTQQVAIESDRLPLQKMKIIS